jgi:glyoxylase-like metal-dependent hydrolase (beta-lactamase superfamily II)
VFLVSVLTQLWDENCYILAADAPGDAVIVDPGLRAAEPVGRIAAEHGLRPVAVLATHGHLDHVADAALLADRYGVPCHIHPADRPLLSDPAAGLGPLGAAVTAELLGAAGLAEPAAVAEVAGGDELELAGLSWTVFHAPGHRPGCVIYRVATPKGLIAFTGDVLFAGSVGRTDLPGGSPKDLVCSLRDVVLGSGPDGPNLPDATALLPGHGPATTMAAERKSNPYLQPRFLEAV